jgi:hypothetical protein
MQCDRVVTDIPVQALIMDMAYLISEQHMIV